MHLFFDTVWKLHIGEIPEKPAIKDYVWLPNYQADLMEYDSEIAAIKQNALTVGNPEILNFEHGEEYDTVIINGDEINKGEFYPWPGGYETKETMSDGWVPSYNDPDNSGWHPPAEPITVAILTLPEEHFLTKNTMENMTKALEVARTLPCACSDCGMRETESAKKILEFAESLKSSGSVAAPKEEDDNEQIITNSFDYIHIITSLRQQLEQREEALKELLSIVDKSHELFLNDKDWIIIERARKTLNKEF